MKGDRPHRRGIIQRGLVGLTPLLLLYAVISFLRPPPDLGHYLRQFEVTDVRPDGPADRAGIRSGDRLVSFNGIPMEETVSIFRAFSRVKPGNEFAYTVKRGDEILTIRLIAGEPPRDDRIRILIRSLVGVCFILLGLIVYWNRTDRVATLFYSAGLGFGYLMIEPPVSGSIFLQFLIKVAADLCILFVAPAFLQLFLLFPRRKRIHPSLVLLRPIDWRGRVRIRFPLYAVSALIFLASFATNAKLFSTGKIDPRWLLLFQGISAAYLLVCLLGGIAVFLHSYRSTSSRSMRRKLRWVVWGTTLALVPMATINVIKVIRPDTDVPGGPYFILLILLLPLSFGHAIIRYGLLDLELIVKRSILYTLLTAFLAVAYVTLVDVVSKLLRDMVGGTDILPTLLSLFFIALLFSPARNIIQGWVDRTLYQEKYRYRRTLHEFSQALTTILDLKKLLDMLVERISTTLHVPRVAVLLRDEPGGNHLLQAGTGLAAAGDSPIAFSSDARIIQHIKRSQESFPVDRVADGEGTVLLPREEREMLDLLDASLLIPLTSGKELAGIISLGRKQSGEFFSSEDRELLNTLANQATLAIENAKLHLDTIEKERLKRELQLAREIQLQSLPPFPPRIPNVDVAALNIPSEEVGGDYYDYVLSDQSLGVVVGDAVGHGVTAALLMASLQATFQAEAKVNRSPAETLQSINSQIYSRTQSERFVTVFYGLLDRESNLFRYANAGHTPPLLAHSDGTHEFLDGSDLILGVDDSVRYREHTTQLEKGDTLLLFTDGVTDEPNDQEESFGSDRLSRTVLEIRDQSASRICNQVYRDVMAFLDNEPRDDVTLLALKLT